MRNFGIKKKKKAKSTIPGVLYYVSNRLRDFSEVYTVQMTAVKSYYLNSISPNTPESLLTLVDPDAMCVCRNR